MGLFDRFMGVMQEEADSAPTTKTDKHTSKSGSTKHKTKKKSEPSPSPFEEEPAPLEDKRASKAPEAEEDETAVAMDQEEEVPEEDQDHEAPEAAEEEEEEKETKVSTANPFANPRPQLAVPAKRHAKANNKTPVQQALSDMRSSRMRTSAIKSGIFRFRKDSLDIAALCAASMVRALAETSIVFAQHAGRRTVSTKIFNQAAKRRFGITVYG
jgi:histone H3/H4